MMECVNKVLVALDVHNLSNKDRAEEAAVLEANTERLVLAKATHLQNWWHLFVAGAGYPDSWHEKG